jgi:hypothetical protein
MGRLLSLVLRARRIFAVVASRRVVDSDVDINERVSASDADARLTAMLAEGFVRFFLAVLAVLAAASNGGSQSKSMVSERGT